MSQGTLNDSIPKEYHITSLHGLAETRLVPHVTAESSTRFLLLYPRSAIASTEEPPLTHRDPDRFHPLRSSHFTPLDVSATISGP
jgi:hypothetical protein